MASATESPQLGYPITDLNGRRITYIVNPRSPPPSHSHGRPVTRPPMFPNALLQENRKRHFQNNNNTTTTAKTSSTDKVPICLIVTIIFFSIASLICVPLMLFFVFGPHSPTLSVEHVSMPYPLFYTSPTRLSSFFNITLKLNNPSPHVGVFFEPENSIVATYSGVRLCSGGLPPFFQAPKAETTVKSALKGVGVQLPDDVYRRLRSDHDKQRVPLGLNVMGMVRFKMGTITLRAFLKASCEVVVDSMQRSSPRIISSSCASASGLWVAAIRP